MALLPDSPSLQLFYSGIPIPRESPSIRLLRVEPGQNFELLSCHLHKVSLSSAPPYKALSYTWANRNESFDPLTHIIRCNDMQMPISENLSAALRRIRDTQLPVEIWVDSICINQTNLTERSSQVGL